MSFGYGAEVKCDFCGTLNEQGVITVSLPLPYGNDNRYYCPRCSLIVEIPKAVESRFILQLKDDQTDQFGNPSWFRSQLATVIKRFAQPDRLYALTKIPQLRIDCPEDKIPLEPWDDYPTPKLLCCRKCGQRSVKMGGATWISGSVITPW